MSKNEESWLANYEVLKAHVIQPGHYPNKQDKGLIAKLIKQMKLPSEHEQMVYELEEMQSGSHTGGAVIGAKTD